MSHTSHTVLIIKNIMYNLISEVATFLGNPYTPYIMSDAYNDEAVSYRLLMLMYCYILYRTGVLRIVCGCVREDGKNGVV